MTEKRYTRSASQLNVLTDCSMKFYLERFKKIPSRPAAWTARGIAVHDAALRWEQSNRELDLVALATENYDAEIERYWASEPNPANWMSTPRTKSVKNDIEYRRKDVIKQCKDYIQHCEDADWEVYRFPDGSLACEVPFEVVVNGVTVRGSIDLIPYWPGDDILTIRDLKTGAERKKYYQLGVYRFAAQKILGLEIDYGEYWYTKLNRSSGYIDLRRYDAEYLGMLFERVDNIIQKELFLPSPGKDCEMCPVKKYCPEMGWEKWSG